MVKSKKSLILVVDPAVKTPELETFNRLAQTSPVSLTYHLPALFGSNSLQKLSDHEIKGIIVLGSLSSVNEKLPWQFELGALLKKHIDLNTPILGLCFGHQLMAHLFGGKVDFVFPDQKKHLGFREVTLKENPLWGSSRKGELYVSHQEHVVSVPKDFVVTAESESIPIEGLAHASLPIWTFQPHPEKEPKSGDRSRFLFGHQLVDHFLHFCAGK
jgi:GMP synthase-like glutamine amidotransferase